MTVAEKQQMLVERARAQAENRIMARLETPAGERDYLATEDKAFLASIVKRLEVAYGKTLPVGYKFNDVIETIVMIASRLQFANKEVRELLQPGAGEIDLYQIFDRETRDELIQAYEQLPYNRKPTELTMLDGTVEVLDADLVQLARVGRRADIPTLNNAIERISLKLALYGTYEASQKQEDTQFEEARIKLERLDKLSRLQGQLEA